MDTPPARAGFCLSPLVMHAQRPWRAERACLLALACAARTPSWGPAPLEFPCTWRAQRQLGGTSAAQLCLQPTGAQRAGLSACLRATPSRLNQLKSLDSACFRSLAVATQAPPCSCRLWLPCCHTWPPCFVGAALSPSCARLVSAGALEGGAPARRTAPRPGRSGPPQPQHPSVLSLPAPALAPHVF